MSFIDPDKIIVPEHRFRDGVGSQEDFNRLKESIAEVGQIHPILTKPDLTLLAGFRRLTACKELKRQVWYKTTTDGQITVESDLQQRRIELQENLCRLNTSPIETARAIAAIDSLMKEEYGQAHGNKPGWSYAQTAKLLGYESPSSVSDMVQIAAAAEEIPELQNAKTIKDAMSVVKHRVKLAAQAELAKRLREKDARNTDSSFDLQAFLEQRVVLSDALGSLCECDSAIVNYFVTDPPYAIQYDAMTKPDVEVVHQGLGIYEDNPAEMYDYLCEVIAEMHRVAKADSWVYWFCDFRYWADFCRVFKKVGFLPWFRPIIWVKTSVDKNLLYHSVAHSPDFGPAAATDCILFARKGQPVLARRGQPDVVFCPPVNVNKRIHRAQRPIELLTELISRLYYDGTRPLLCDPFIGSGSTLAAAMRFPGIEFFGYEKYPEFRNRAIDYLTAVYHDLHNPEKPIIYLDESEMEDI